ncbi:3-phosphoshikimate 1-carboxyvinyltransferase [Keratinibaculum paraultunense]|uniref:3-phosphoshikimate 1-carboxyvinyltransferase n=1 Tax=Keratinibaculum paraultunense TaxID=1278232 RepID=A0A4V2UUK2_9FIRM|nr:3-phosphoshikimate 1-carboxyvinyltransferase [Keratinibaculum paraultunense]TCS91244.1 3-phosphoshikimate 1-carboxyvinyltransferase [Keratinibaculum paraultunense]
MIIDGSKCKLVGKIKVPGDKSISHRAVILGSIAKGLTVIENILISEDVIKTIDAFKNMGVNIEIMDEKVLIKGVGIHGLKKPNTPIYCGNSGTTMRLLSGLLVGQKFSSILTGDDSLVKRPMDRIIIPLSKMGANIKGVKNKYPPLSIKPTNILTSICYKMPVASAQVKSSILLATLYAKGTTKIIENKITRDHTERMLKLFGANIRCKGNEILMDSENELYGKKLYIPGDISSAAYFIVAALLIKGSHIIIEDVGINPTRAGILSILKKMGGNIIVFNEREINCEPIGDIEVKYSKLRGITIEEDEIGKLIDEVPIIAVAATLAEGRTIIKGVNELKYKESNRIKTITEGLSNMGAYIKILPDRMIIEGVQELKPAFLNSYDDHRIAMALSIAALTAKGSSHINKSECINISYPEFYTTLFKLLQ